MLYLDWDPDLMPQSVPERSVEGRETRFLYGEQGLPALAGFPLHLLKTEGTKSTSIKNKSWQEQQQKIKPGQAS